MVSSQALTPTVTAIFLFFASPIHLLTMDEGQRQTRSGSKQKQFVVRVILGGQDWEHIFMNNSLFQDLDDFVIYIDPTTKKQYEVVFVALNHDVGDFKVFALLPPVGQYFEIESPSERLMLFKHIKWKNGRLLGDKKFEGTLNFHDSVFDVAKNGPGLNQVIDTRLIHVSSSPQVSLFEILQHVTF